MLWRLHETRSSIVQRWTRNQYLLQVHHEIIVLWFVFLHVYRLLLAVVLADGDGDELLVGFAISSVGVGGLDSVCGDVASA